MDKCPICGSDHLMEITTLFDTHERYICGSGHQLAVARSVPCMALLPYGPPVPTPEDILIGAGLDPGLL